jgi:prepilin-type N-terminal cleavage/methylation domain-containing protein
MDRLKRPDAGFTPLETAQGNFFAIFSGWVSTRMNAWGKRDSQKRFKKPFLSQTGFTLLELLIAAMLFGVVLLTASNLLINFGLFSTNLARSEASLMGTALGALEEISLNISEANQVTGVPATPATSSTITLRVDNAASPTPAVFTNDTTYTYWLDSATRRIMRTGVAGDGAGKAIARDIDTLSFSFIPAASTNAVRVALTAQAVNEARENLETVVVARSRRA